MRHLAILGGIGHAAAALAHQHLVTELTRRARPDSDQQLPDITVRSVSAPQTSAKGWKPEDDRAMREWLERQLEALRAGGADGILPACVSLRPLITELGATDCLRLPDRALYYAKLNGLTELNVLSSARSRQGSWLNEVAEAYGITLHWNDQAATDHLIASALRGQPDQAAFEQITAAGGRPTLLACTELSLYTPRSVVFDALRLAAHDLAQRWWADQKENDEGL